MQILSERTESTDTFYTNSTIDAAGESKVDDVSYFWRRVPMGCSEKFRKIGIGGHLGPPTLYTCSPLDYSFVVELIIRSRREKRVLAYGPVMLENSLVSYLSEYPLHCSQPYTSPTFDGVVLQSTPQSAKMTLTHIPSSKTILTICPGTKSCSLTPISVSLSILQECSSKEVLKIQKHPTRHILWLLCGDMSATHLIKNGYIELQFFERLSRDKFICEIMRINGVFEAEGNKYKYDFQQQQMLGLESMMLGTARNSKKMTLQHSVVFRGDADNEHIKKDEGATGLMTIETLEKDFNDIISSKSHMSDDDIVDDFRDILYTPSGSQNIPCMKDKKTEASSCQKEALEKPSSNQEYLNLLTSCRSIVGDTLEKTDPRKRNFLPPSADIQTLRPIQQEFLEPELSEVLGEEKAENNMNFVNTLKPKKKISCSPQMCKTSKIGRAVEGADSKNQEARIANLLNLNLELLEENRRLKEENRKLKLKDSCKSDDIWKIINEMAVRIHFLETYNKGKISEKKFRKVLAKRNNHKRQPSPKKTVISADRERKFFSRSQKEFQNANQLQVNIRRPKESHDRSLTRIPTSLETNPAIKVSPPQLLRNSHNYLPLKQMKQKPVFSHIYSQHSLKSSELPTFSGTLPQKKINSPRRPAKLLASERNFRQDGSYVISPSQNLQ